MRNLRRAAFRNRYGPSGTRAPVVLPAALMAAMVILDAVSATRTLSAEEGCRARLGLADVWTILI
jgi:hypothetical protein